MKRFAPAFVVTVSSLCPAVALPTIATTLVACHKDETDTSTLIGNSTAPTAAPSHSASVTFIQNPPFVREPPRIRDGNDAGTDASAQNDTPAPVSTQIPWGNVQAYSITLNAEVEGNTAYVSGDKTCFVKLPFDHPIRSWQPRPTKRVACPASMRDPLWSQCIGGSVMAKPGHLECVCTSDGNPPPPPHTLACPR